MPLPNRPAPLPTRSLPPAPPPTAPAAPPAPPATPASPTATGTPSAPHTAAHQYRAVASLTADELLDGSADQFDHLQPTIVQIREWLQDWLTTQGRAEEIAEARLDPAKRKVMAAELDRILIQYLAKASVARGADRGVIVASVIHEILGLGPIEPLWSDSRITEVMVNGPSTVFVEINGRLLRAPGAKFRDSQHVLEVCQQILMPLNRRVDQKSPLADGRLPDGSRVNIVHGSVAPHGPLLTIRRFPETVWTMKDLIENGSLTEEMAVELAWLIYHKASTVVVGATGAGKALAASTPIPTPTGMTTMGALTVGDQVLDENGTPCTVTGKFTVADPTVYQVTFSDGTQVLADADHNWWTTTSTGAGVRTTKEIAATCRTVTGAPAHTVPMIPGPVTAWPHRDLPVHPYSYGARLAGALAEGPAAPAGSTGGREPRIPADYLYASEPQRRALLAGVLDTLGAVTPDGQVTVTGPNQVIDALRLLVQSLGYQATTTPSAPGTPGPRARTLLFTAADDVFQQPSLRGTHRWRRAQGHHKDQPRHRHIVAVTEVTSTEEFSCITVDSPTHLYLCTDAFLPTHNTSLLNALSSCIPRDERVVTVEDNLELQLHPHAHVAALEARPAAASGEGEVTIRSLVKNALRMRPDRIVVGEVRDASALDMLQAMNTGHEGSLTTVHANGAEEAISRLGVLVAQGGQIPDAKVQWLIGDAVDLVVLQRRYEDGSRRVQGIYEVPSMRASTTETLTPIPLWVWEQTGTDDHGKFLGQYVKKNDLSDALIRARRLHLARRFTVEDVYRMSELPAEMTKGSH